MECRVCSLSFYQHGVCDRLGWHVLSIIISVDQEERGVSVLLYECVSLVTTG